MDVEKLTKIVRQKPFYLASPMEMPAKMLELANKTEELKFDLLKNGKDMDGFLDTIDYLTTENNILKCTHNLPSLSTQLNTTIKYRPERPLLNTHPKHHY